MPMRIPKHILPVIVIAQFCCTSLWFAGNAILDDLVAVFNLTQSALGAITAAVQFGFICGTLVFASLMIADRFSPSHVFLVCAFLGALFNLGILMQGNTLYSILFFRFATGFFIAGIYPVGMKIAADYFDKGLGRSLGFLVGALVLGTAFPHLIKGMSFSFQWEIVLWTTAAIAVFGGIIIGVFVPNGPFRKKSQQLKLSAFIKVFEHREFKQAAFGYFGHMWELYAFWAFIPVIISSFNTQTNAQIPVAIGSFGIIAVGSLGCIIAGFLSKKYGSKKIASIALTISGLCCLLSPFLWQLPALVFLGVLVIWGISVIADSPMFSTLVAQNAHPKLKGTALTIVNCIGFAITILSIQLLSYLSELFPINYVFIILALGPIFGLYSLYKKV